MRNTDLAPIALFIFRRPEHTRRMIESLKRCEGFAESPIFVFCEGPRNDDERDVVQNTRQVARELLGDAATYVERERNLGLANSIVAGVTALCDEFGKAIVIEDDLIVAPGFLSFLNRGLTRYADDEEVMHISGYMYDVHALDDVTEAQFLPMMSSWGWATWQRAWDLYDIRATGWQEKLSTFRDRWKFDLDGHANHWRMLNKQMRGDLDTWDIQWYYAMFVHQGLALFPPGTLVRNDGMDGTGTHYTRSSEAPQQELAPFSAFTLPDHIEESRFKKDVYAELRKLVWRTRVERMKTILGSRLRKLQRP